MNTKTISWVLRISVAGEFIGHGVFALQGKKDWITWTQKLGGMEASGATQFIFFVGLLDLAMAVVVLIRPVRLVLLWMAFWGFWTALVRPLVGMPVWDFIERWANWGAPLALLLLLGWPKNLKEWFCASSEQSQPRT